MSRITLFTLPFAGGSKYSYNTFTKFLPAFIDFQPLEVPGRGERISDDLVADIHRMADDIFQQIKKHDLKNPYAIYGHSMGSILAYLVSQKIADAKLPRPLHLILTGAAGPSWEERERSRHLLSKADFKKKLEEYGGSPKEVLENEELFEFFEPILRNDFQAVETYYYTKPAEKLDVPVTVMIGLSEQVTIDEARLWEQETTAPFSVRQFPGGHFFIYDYTAEVVKVIATQLSKCVIS